MSETTELRRLALAATPGPWRGTTEGSYDQKHAAAKAYESVMARRVPDLPDAQWSDLSWVRTSGDDWLNVALVGNGANGPENAHYIAAVDPQTVLALLDVVDAARGLFDWPDAGARGWACTNEIADNIRAALDRLAASDPGGEQ